MPKSSSGSFNAANLRKSLEVSFKKHLRSDAVVIAQKVYQVARDESRKFLQYVAGVIEQQRFGVVSARGMLHGHNWFKTGLSPDWERRKNRHLVHGYFKGLSHINGRSENLRHVLADLDVERAFGKPILKTRFSGQNVGPVIQMFEITLFPRATATFLNALDRRGMLENLLKDQDDFVARKLLGRTEYYRPLLAPLMQNYITHTVMKKLRAACSVSARYAK